MDDIGGHRALWRRAVRHKGEGRCAGNEINEVDDADVLGVEEVRPEGNCASLRDMEICDDVIFPFRYCGVAIESTPIEHSTIALGQWTKPMTRMCWKWKRYNTR